MRPHSQHRSVAVSACGVLLLGMTTACRVGPTYQKPAVPMTPTFKEQDGWKQAQPQDAMARGKWWELFNDPQLNALEEQVDINNQNIAQVEAQFRSARSAVRVARSALFPTIGTSPSITRSQQSSNRTVGVGGVNGVPVSGVNGTGSTGSGSTAGTGTTATTTTTAGRQFTDYQFPFDFSYEFDAWGRIRNQIAASVATAQASAADLETARLSAHSLLATDYFELRGADQRRQLLEQTVADYERQLQLTIDRFNQGIATQLEVEQARTQLETARTEAIDVGVQRSQLEHAIATLTGKPPATVSLPVSPISVPPPAIPGLVPSELLERRPDIASAERRVASQNAEVGVAQAAFYPSIGLTASFGFASSTVSRLFSWPSHFWSVGPALAQTLFDAGARRGTLEQARAGYDATVAAYRQSVLTAFQDVEDQLAALRILEQEAAQQEAAIRAAQRSVDLSVLRYRNGVSNYLDVITAENALLTARSAAVDILTRRMTASVALIKAVGGGWNASSLPSAQDLRSNSSQGNPAKATGQSGRAASR